MHPPLARRIAAGAWLPAPLVRASILFVLAIFIGEGIAHGIFAVGNWTLEDANAYWAAAERLRAGQPLYSYFDPNSNEVIRYAPWFAYAWIPLTYLPRAIVDIGWSALLVAASVAAVVPLLRRPTPAALAIAGLLGPFLLWTASRGNLQPLLVAALVHGVERRSGPLWIALAASLKAVPILYVLVYAGRGEWGRVAIAVALTALLTGQMLLFDLSSFASDAGGSQSLLFISPVVWAAAAAIGLALALVSAFVRRRYAWLGASTAAMAVLPRFFLYDLTYLLVGTAGRREPPR
jgi:hypothetical protein